MTCDTETIRRVRRTRDTKSVCRTAVMLVCSRRMESICMNFEINARHIGLGTTAQPNVVVAPSPPLGHVASSVACKL